MNHYEIILTSIHVLNKLADSCYLIYPSMILAIKYYYPKRALQYSAPSKLLRSSFFRFMVEKLNKVSSSETPLSIS